MVSNLSANDVFETKSGFCSDCGTILPPLPLTGDITCYSCKRVYPIQVFENQIIKYTVHFNSVKACERNAEHEKMRKAGKLNEAEGPTVERRCPKCDNNVMSYATVQLRSADEGQTIFYTCTKCKYKESENS